MRFLDSMVLSQFRSTFSARKSGQSGPRSSDLIQRTPQAFIGAINPLGRLCPIHHTSGVYGRHAHSVMFLGELASILVALLFPR